MRGHLGWDGYQVVFALRDAMLVLADLHVNLLQEGEGFQRKASPAINGVQPIDSGEKSHFFNNHYQERLRFIPNSEIRIPHSQRRNDDRKR